ncbi:MAG: rod shape-determining protein MreC [Candidatus Nitronauta litoralis]|uniref:Cell shape-determining protein MreC n=1 Tax=Candidatus Nitronauta litoralis TaxID=2705533 RepID=A0A7T0BT86_9BACT|nr:MAG: rod shape-determining protein MreC [Candidatus Nitronauta litoralis]
MWKRGIKSRKNTIVLILIFLVGFALMTADSKRPDGAYFFESFILLVVSPIQSVITGTLSSIEEVYDHYFSLVDASKENEQLHSEINTLKRENHLLKEEVRRLNRIGQLIEYQAANSGESVVATVVGKDATQWVKTIFINKGTDDGVYENLAVVTNSGVVGHVIQAGPHSSKVLLLVDRRSAVDSLFRESRVPGVVVGLGVDTCEMKYVPITADVKAGDWVLSSGLGGVFPKGLVVGRVLSVAKSKQGLFQEIKIAPGADFSRLEEVLVLLP